MEQDVPVTEPPAGDASSPSTSSDTTTVASSGSSSRAERVPSAPVSAPAAATPDAGATDAAAEEPPAENTAGWYANSGPVVLDVHAAVGPSARLKPGQSAFFQTAPVHPHLIPASGPTAPADGSDAA
jgi:hypothetical protein